ncbi:malonate transporter subunit MadL [Melittangium boletus]|uniref:Malonate carrier protein n=1 Tax=Melittangium boletus DSM 14713 TaxID=1294270 RepID=A0A250IAK2_9BACT|nr:malonate transporter subunit MadL [Melittangium boletus]ATB28218.1 malonate carrier protein [Melittangium boletus DSM 14713]
MTIYGVALLALCTLVGVVLGELLGEALGVKANVGGVGIAMVLLILARLALVRREGLSPGIKSGVEFWAHLYIPIVVAMAAQQNVVAAVRGGPVVIVAGVGATVVCACGTALLSRLGRPSSPTPRESIATDSHP